MTLNIEMTPTKDALLNMICEAQGYLVSEQVLRCKHLFYYVNLLSVDNDNTIKYRKLVNKFKIKLEKNAYLEAFLELIKNRDLYEKNPPIVWEIEEFNFSFITAQWIDNLGEHTLLRATSKKQSSQIYVFDIDSLGKKYFVFN